MIKVLLTWFGPPVAFLLGYLYLPIVPAFIVLLLAGAAVVFIDRTPRTPPEEDDR